MRKPNTPAPTKFLDLGGLAVPRGNLGLVLAPSGGLVDERTAGEKARARRAEHGIGGAAAAGRTASPFRSRRPVRQPRIQELLARYALLSSMSRRANCWDNAVAESFFATLKVELVQQTR